LKFQSLQADLLVKDFRPAALFVVTDMSGMLKVWICFILLWYVTPAIWWLSDESMN